MGKKSIKDSLLLMTVLMALSQQCLVDKCMTCVNKTNNRCQACQQGWYLMNYNGAQRPYNECWSLTKLWLSVIGGTLLSLLLCGLCYYCYILGKKKLAGNVKRQNPMIPNPQDPGYMMSDRSPPTQMMTPRPQYSPETLPVYQPQPVRGPPMQQRSPQVIRQPPPMMQQSPQMRSPIQRSPVQRPPIQRSAMRQPAFDPSTVVSPPRSPIKLRGAPTRTMNNSATASFAPVQRSPVAGSPIRRFT